MDECSSSSQAGLSSDGCVWFGLIWLIWAGTRTLVAMQRVVNSWRGPNLYLYLISMLLTTEHLPLKEKMKKKKEKIDSLNCELLTFRSSTKSPFRKPPHTSLTLTLTLLPGSAHFKLDSREKTHQLVYLSVFLFSSLLSMYAYPTVTQQQKFHP